MHKGSPCHKENRILHLARSMSKDARSIKVARIDSSMQTSSWQASIDSQQYKIPRIIASKQATTQDQCTEDDPKFPVSNHNYRGQSLSNLQKAIQENCVSNDSCNWRTMQDAKKEPRHYHIKNLMSAKVTKLMEGNTCEKCQFII